MTDKSIIKGGSTPSFSGTPGSNRLKLILKVGGSSTPEHSDSPGPSSSLSVLNVGCDEDSQQSNMSLSHLSHSKKSKKKDKKNKKEKKHKHRHKVKLYKIATMKDLNGKVDGKTNEDVSG